MNKEEKLLYSLSAIKQVIGTFDIDIEVTAVKDGNEYVINAYNEIEKCVVDYVNSLQPYKFENLKSGIWVWDDRLKACFLIKEIKPKTYWNIVVYANYLINTLEELNFEENRFYPVSKAMGRELDE